MEEFNIKVEEGRRKDAVTYSHPSYGMISIGRFSGDMTFFGEDAQRMGGIRVTLEEAEVTQDLGRNWYFGRKKIAEVMMSSLQYAEMISNPNTCGVPCTIRYRKDIGHIKYAAPTEKITHVRSKVELSIDELKTKTASISNEVKELLGGKLRAAEKKENHGSGE